MKAENWIDGDFDGIKFKYLIDPKKKNYKMKIISHIPRGYYYAYENEIGKMIEEKHWEELK